MVDRSIKDTLETARERVQRTAAHARDDLAARADRAGATISEIADRTRRRAVEMGEHTYDGGGRMARSVVKAVDERPLASALVLGAAVLCGLSFLLLRRR